MRNLVWKTLFIVGISLVNLNSFAAEVFKCGEYEFNGVIRKVDGVNVLKIYEGSTSETVLTLAPDLQELAEVHQDQSVTVKGKMFKPIQSYRGYVASMLTSEEYKDLTSEEKPYSARFMRNDMAERIADPLHPETDSGMKLVKELGCDSREPSSKKSSPKKPKKK